MADINTLAAFIADRGALLKAEESINSFILLPIRILRRRIGNGCRSLLLKYSIAWKKSFQNDTP